MKKHIWTLLCLTCLCLSLIVFSACKSTEEQPDQTTEAPSVTEQTANTDGRETNPVPDVTTVSPVTTAAPDTGTQAPEDTGEVDLPTTGAGEHDNDENWTDPY